jgi:predicted chitinase
MTNLTPERIFEVTKAPLANVQANWPLVLDALTWSGINTRLTQIGMAATIAVETGKFTPLREVKSTRPESPIFKAQSRYWSSGFYGRGYIQLTWKDNYEAASKALGVDLIANPDLAMQSDIAARIAAWFFKLRNIHSHCERKDWHSVRRLVNGPGYAAHAQSLQRFLHFCKLLEV